MAVTFARLRLIHFSYDSPWNPFFAGGGAQRDWEILRRLPEPWSATYAVGGFDGCEPVDAPVVWLGRGKGRWSSRASYVRAASAYARANPPGDGIWSISPSVFAPVPAYLAHPSRTVVSLFHLVGWNAWSKYGPMGLVALWHERQILSRMRHFVCINEATASQVRRSRPDADVVVLPTGYTPLADVAVERDPSRILFFGRMDVYMKGLDRLLDSFAAVSERAPDASLVLAGRADQGVQARLSRMVEAHPRSDRIRLEFNPDDEAKARLFRSAGVFCSPSRFEGWCIAGVEAQSGGVPVVASTADGFLDSVDDGRSGILVPNDESTVVEGVASALLRILSDRELAARLGRGGIDKASRLTWDAVAASHDELFRAVHAGTR